MPLHEDVLWLEQELRAALPELVSQRALARACEVDWHAIAERVARGQVPAVPAAGGGARRAGVPAGWAVDLVTEVVAARAQGGRRVLAGAIALAEHRRGRQ